MDVHPKHFGIVLKFDKLKRKVQLLLQVVNKINAEKVLDGPFRSNKSNLPETREIFRGAILVPLDKYERLMVNRHNSEVSVCQLKTEFNLPFNLRVKRYPPNRPLTIHKCLQRTDKNRYSLLYSINIEASEAILMGDTLYLFFNLFKNSDPSPTRVRQLSTVANVI